MLKKTHKIVDAITSFLILIVIIVILFCLYSFFSLKILNRSYVNIFGYSFFQVATGSMKDAINEGDVVIVKINADYQEGDIITYMSGKDFITHRVIEKNDDYVITKGDNNNTNDNPIDKGLILGKVTKIIPKVKTIKQVLLSPKVIILIFITLFCLSLLFSYNGNRIKIVKVEEIKEIKKPKKKKEEKKEIVKEKIIKDDIPKEKKKLEATQIIDVEEINKQKKKKILDATQIIDISKIKK